ncbi:hypothetical protein QQP08_015436 [Theobroma cacao]|nr:hypothetical protein QQP08_015436 [Theobroma cacao]
MKHDEEENPPWIYVAAYIIAAYKFFGLMWFSLSLFKMELKRPEENLSQTPLVLAIILYYGFAFGFLMPSIIVYGAASILCYILVPISWRLLKNFIGNLVKHPDANGALATVLVLPFLFGFCVILLKHSSELRYREEILEDCKEFSKFRY